jgi:hypothetical protein
MQEGVSIFGTDEHLRSAAPGVPVAEGGRELRRGLILGVGRTKAQ